MTILIRPAHVGEAEEIATFHVKVWRETYLDIAPAEAIEKLDAQHRLPAWQKYLRAPEPRQHVLVAVNNDTIVGLVSFGPPTHPVFGTRGEVKHLYVDPMCKRQGIGRSLMRAAFQQMTSDGFESVALAMARGNSKALAFYTAMGGIAVGSFIDAGPIWKSDNLVIAWNVNLAF